jgi:hypothetical protein
MYTYTTVQWYLVLRRRYRTVELVLTLVLWRGLVIHHPGVEIAPVKAGVGEQVHAEVRQGYSDVVTIPGEAFKQLLHLIRVLLADICYLVWVVFDVEEPEILVGRVSVVPVNVSLLILLVTVHWCKCAVARV